MKRINLKAYMGIIVLAIGILVSTVLKAEDKEIIIDVRTQAEWSQGHIKDAVLIPYDVISTKIAAVTKDKNKKINVYCRSGRRSEIARQTLVKLGYTNVQNLGGYDALAAKGYPVAK